jgi:uncharacterized membrane protein YdfJ with MMPL/SSD domain
MPLLPNQLKEDVMNGIKTLSGTLGALSVMAPNAFAAESVKVYSSSILVLAFVGFLALIVVVQLIPAVITLLGALNALARKTENSEIAEAESGRD